jgi:PadR family transcriptional regulator
LTFDKTDTRLLSTVKGRYRVGKPVDVVQGTVDLLIMKAVALEPMHGWAVAQRIKQLSQDVLRVNQGSLYPALQRLEREGWITAEWGLSENNRRARFYRLTKAGRRHLAREQANWERLSSAIALVLRTA